MTLDMAPTRTKPERTEKKELGKLQEKVTGKTGPARVTYRKLAEGLKDPLVLPCDVQRDEDIAAVFDEIGTKWGQLDVLVHSLAFAPRESLDGRFVGPARELEHVGQREMRTRAVAFDEGRMNVVSDRLNCRASACWVAPVWLMPKVPTLPSHQSWAASHSQAS